MLFLIGWLVYGLIVGSLAKLLHPGEDPIGLLPTLGIGVAGSYIGGLINWVVGSGEPFSSSGLIMGVVGGVIMCWAYRNYRLNRFFQAQGRMPKMHVK
jgi:uncharacterized membrane protein YeaQ/YmgE (transglycosylase-associated protein family)